MRDHDHPPNKTGLGEEEDVELAEMPSIQEDTSPNAPLIRAREDDDNALHDGPTTPSALQHSGNAFIWALTVAACVSGLLFGYDTASISGMLVSIGTDLSSRPLSNLDKGFITSSTSFFALVASPVAGSLADTVGRKNIILFSDGLFIFGALWQAFTSSAWGMILGRSVVGFAIGGASLIVPLYIAELAPGHLRGRLVTVTLLFITGGQVIAYLVGWAFSTMSGGWRWMVGLGAAPAIAQIAMLVFMPETPRFLAKAQKEVEARAVLAKVYRGMVPDTSELIAETMSAIKKEILEEEEAHVQLKTSESGSCIPATLHSLLLHPPHARALAITCILQGLQQLCGFNSLMYFSATIFQRLRFSSPTLTSLSVAGTNFLFTIAAFHLIDRVGRRRILLITVPLMTVALVLCATAFSFVEAPQQHQIKVPESNADTIPNTRLPAIGILVAILLYVSTYAMGLGPVPWQQSELFPLSVRSLGSGLATATNWGCNTVVGLTFLPMMDLLTPTWTFVSYALVCLIGWLIIWHIYPETMGLGLEQVGDLLKDGWGVKESMDRLKATRRSRRALE